LNACKYPTAGLFSPLRTWFGRATVWFTISAAAVGTYLYGTEAIRTLLERIRSKRSVSVSIKKPAISWPKRRDHRSSPCLKRL